MSDERSVYTSRAWQGPDDRARVHAFLRARYRLQGPPSYPSTSDFDYWLAMSDNPAVPHGIQLWFDGDSLIGYVWPKDDEVQCVVHPHATAAVPEIFGWAEARLQANPPPEGVIKAWCVAGDLQMAALLAAAGYTRTDDFLRCNVFAMDGALPAAPALLPGYTVRALRGPEEAAARSAAHVAAFPDWPMDAAKHQRAMQSATYQLERDIVATAPDGAIVAVIIAWYDPALRMGLFEPIGCHPAHQRRGLATACIVEGLQRLKEAGAEVAVVCGWRDDSEGSRLYAKLGFHEGERQYVWERQLAAETSSNLNAMH
jgi:ribosomal protein S18 acetylase RimI-like enzyme